MTTRALQLYEEVQRFHEAHPEVWGLFMKFALEKVQAGHKHYSADAIMHRVRWESPAGGGDFKVNNNFIAFYARRFARVFPTHKEFFRMRRQKSADQILGASA